LFALKLDVAGSISVACAGLVKIKKLHGYAHKTLLANGQVFTEGHFAQKLIAHGILTDFTI
jgi:hypothetical protein